jgi:hypothetical protein
MIFQLFMSVIYVALMVGVVYNQIMTYTVGRPGLYWLTFFFSFVLSQIWSLFFLVLIWFMLVKRCGYLKSNEKTYMSPDDVSGEEEGHSD